MPTGLLSFSFTREELDPAAGRPASAPRSMLVVRAGRDFEAPKGVGYGRFTGVEVWDFGPGAVPPIEWTVDVSEHIAGAPVRHVEEQDPPIGYTAPCWLAVVEDRYVVQTSSRDMLERALLRSGRLDAILQPFAAVRHLAADATVVVCALPRPDDRSYWGRPVPVETTVSAVSGAPARLRVLHREPLPVEYQMLLDQFGSASATGQRLADGWIVSVSGEVGDGVLRGLAFDMLFGLAIFI